MKSIVIREANRESLSFETMAKNQVYPNILKCIYHISHIKNPSCIIVVPKIFPFNSYVLILYTPDMQ